MAPRPPAVGVAKVTFNQTCSGRSFGDSLYFSHASAEVWTTGELTSLAENCQAEWMARIAPQIDAPYVLVSTDALDLSDTDGRLGISEGGGPGTKGGTEPLPLNAVCRISFEVLRRYRGGRPGINISGLDATGMSDERLFSTAQVTAISDGMTALITGVVAGSGYLSPIIHVGVSYVLNKVERVTPLVLPIVAQEVQERLSTLRKRLGRGVAGG